MTSSLQAGKIAAKKSKAMKKSLSKRSSSSKAPLLPESTINQFLNVSTVKRFGPLCSSLINMGVSTFVNSVYAAEHGSLEAVVKVFHRLGYEAALLPEFRKTPFSRRFLKLSYKHNNGYWRSKWACEAKGSVLFLTEGGKWINFKHSWHPGSETLLATQLNRGVDAGVALDQNIDFQRMELHQQETLRRMVVGGPIEGSVISRLDGHLITLTCYRSDFLGVASSMIDCGSDPMTKRLRDLAVKTKCGFIPVFSSQTTLFTNLHETICSTFLPTLGIVSSERLKELVKEGMNPIDLLSDAYPYGKELLAKLSTLAAGTKDRPICSFTFELACANRANAWGDAHTELATAYPSPMVRVLGRTQFHESLGSSEVIWEPHHTFSRDIAAAGFKEALHWRVKDVSEIKDLLGGLSRCLRGDPVDNFMTEHPPSNRDATVEKVLDWEGLTFQPDSGNFYIKITPPEYYACHRFRHLNYSALIQHSCQPYNYFVVTSTVLNYLDSLRTKLPELLHELRSHFLAHADKLGALRFDGKPRKVANFQKLSNDKKVYHLVVGSKICFGRDVMNIFRKHFTEFPSQQTKALENLTQKIAHTFVIWKADRIADRVNVAVSSFSSKSSGLWNARKLSSSNNDTGGNTDSDNAGGEGSDRGHDDDVGAPSEDKTSVALRETPAPEIACMQEVLLSLFKSLQ